MWDDRKRSKVDDLCFLRVYWQVHKRDWKENLTEALICSWHRTAFISSVPLNYFAGNFRQENPAMPCLATNVQIPDQIGSFRFIAMEGAPYKHVGTQMSSFFLALEKTLTALKIKIKGLAIEVGWKLIAEFTAFQMGVFNKIHPFVNGNGRITRLLLKWILFNFNLTTSIKSLSRPEPAQEYKTAINKASVRNDYGLLANFLYRSFQPAS